jgi:hypothetical protein
MRVALRGEVNDRIFSAMILPICAALIERKATRAVKQIEIRNGGGWLGYVFEEPQKCAETMKAPAKTVHALIISMSHPTPEK